MKVIFLSNTPSTTREYLTKAIPKYLQLNQKVQSMAKQLTDDMPNELHQTYYELSYELRNLKRDIEIILSENNLSFTINTSHNQDIWIEVKHVEFG